MTDKKALTAPCGLDCFNCELYEENFIDNAPRHGYVRLELTTGSDQLYHCFTNPIYFD